jgi:CMP-N-acetylneuraminic acid synthetase
MNYICIIPARSGSKRIKNKNIVKVQNKKIFNYTLEAAKKVKKFNKIIVTTDINKIIKKNYHNIFFIKRPNYLCNDKSTTESAIKHAINYFPKFFNKDETSIVLLQPTSPLRTALDINKAIKEFEKGKLDCLFSAFSSKYSFWKRSSLTLKSVNYSYKNFNDKSKQKLFIIENGAIYIFKYKGFVKFKNRLFGKIGYSLMSKMNSLEIDYPEEIEIFKSYLKYNKKA